MKRLFLALFLCLSISGPLFAAEPESLVPSADTSRTNFHFRQTIAPAVLIGTGTFGLTQVWKENVNLPVKDYMTDLRQGYYIHADDYIQYVPLATSLLLCLDKREGWEDRVLLAGTGWAFAGLLVNAAKYTVREMRPDGSRRNSFPSGHSATAFVGAELVRMEYGGWWGAAAYTVAIATGALRMYNERHWCNDVLAGAGVGILSAKIAYWMLPWERRQLGKISFLPWFAPEEDGTYYSGVALNIAF